MKLNRHAREYYAITITTEPDVDGWEASFDGGETWVEADTSGDGFRWLVAGPDADPGTAAVVSRDIAPLVRVIDTPEIVVRNAPPIELR